MLRIVFLELPCTLKKSETTELLPDLYEFNCEGDVNLGSECNSVSIWRINSGVQK